jgi:hypothetical protein
LVDETPDSDEAELEELDAEDLTDMPEAENELPEAKSEIEDLASKIEFSEPVNEIEEDDLDGELEIVSPFATMLSRFNDDGSFKANGEEDLSIQTSGKLEELNKDYSMSLVYRPFQQPRETSSPVELETVDSAVSLIKERDGVNYVNEKVKKPDNETEKNLDPRLKSLVNSVIKKN